MPLPTGRMVHVNRPLTNISIAYIQEQEMFIADQVFPNVPVNKQSDRYFKYLRDEFWRPEAQKRAPATESAGGGWKIDNTPSYFADVWAVHKDVDDQIRANADQPIDMDRDSTTWVTQQLLIRRELEWVENYFAAGVWSTDLVGDAAPGPGEFLYWDADDSDPIKDVTDAAIEIAELTAHRPNVLVLAPRVFNVIRNHEEVIDRIKYTQRGVVTTEILAGLFDVDRVVVPWGVYNTAAEGLDLDTEFIFGDNALLVYANPSPSILQPSGGYIFSWTGYLGAGPAGNRISTFRMPQLNADRIEGEMAFDAKMVAPDLGVFFSNPLEP